MAALGWMVDSLGSFSCDIWDELTWSGDALKQLGNVGTVSASSETRSGMANLRTAAAPRDKQMRCGGV